MRNLLITFEGIDGCGKSTQASLLLDRLLSDGASAVLYREPGGTSVGEKIRSILLDSAHFEMYPMTELFLYLSSRAQITAQCIRPSLESGITVILDRFFDSTVAYQGCARGLGIDLTRTLNGIATGGIIPDVTFLIDCDPAVAYTRLKSSHDRLESEGLAFMQRVRDGFLTLSRLEPYRFVILDGSLPVELIFDSVYAEVKKRAF
jgi:dTMP kinase